MLGEKRRNHKTIRKSGLIINRIEIYNNKKQHARQAALCYNTLEEKEIWLIFITLVFKEEKMKKRKLLSIVLSLALVFSMTAAFTVASSAGDGNDTTVPFVPANNITVCGKSLDAETPYLYIDKTTNEYVNAANLANYSTGGYVFYNKLGKLELHNFVLDGSKLEYDTSNHHYYEPITANNDTRPETTTLSIMLFGKNKLYLSTNGQGAIIANNSVVEINAGDATGSLYSNSYIGGGNGITINSGTIYLDAKSSGNSTDPALNTIGWGGWNKKGAVAIKGGFVTIDGFKKGITSDEQVSISNASLTINNSIDAIWAEAEASIGSGSVNINNFSGNAIYSNDNVNIYGGTVYISEYNGNTGNCGNGILADNVNISGQALVTITDKDEPIGERGITALNNLNITGGQLYISGFHSGVFMGPNWKRGGNIVIKDAVVKITAPNDGIGGDPDSFTIENSDVEILSTATVTGKYAFWAAPNIVGNPIIKAGDNKFNAVYVKATDLVNKYQYVYISKDTSKIWSNISSAISNIGTLISGAKIGSLFSSIFTIFKSSKIFSFLPLLFLLK